MCQVSLLAATFLTVLTCPLISVVVPFLNEEAHLRACLRALEVQTLQADCFEMLFVDNGSTDGSPRIVESFPCVRLLHERRRDPYLARNAGIEAARGQFIAFLDADCVPDPRWLEELAAEICRSRAPVILGYLAYPDGCSPLLRPMEEYYHHKLAHMIENRLEKYYFGHGGNMAVRRDVFLRLGPFLPMPVVGDTEIIHRVLKNWPGSEVAYVPSARVVHAEVSTFRDALKKVHECGGHSETCSQVTDYGTLPLRENLRIFRRTLVAGRYSPRRMLEACFVLFSGKLCFQYGRSRRRAGGRGPMVMEPSSTASSARGEKRVAASR